MRSRVSPCWTRWMTFLEAGAAEADRTGAPETTNFRPTARRLEVRWFQDLSLSTLVLKRVAILKRVSPARTVYDVVRTGAAAVRILAAVEVLDFIAGCALDAIGCGGVTPLIGMASVCPILMTGVFPRLFACEICAVVVPYCFAMPPSVSPFRTKCSRIIIRLLSGNEATC